jgi:formate hydrogenlyase subunit 4
MDERAMNSLILAIWIFAMAVTVTSMVITITSNSLGRGKLDTSHPLVWAMIGFGVMVLSNIGVFLTS